MTTKEKDTYIEILRKQVIQLENRNQNLEAMLQAQREITQSTKLLRDIE